MSTSDSRVEVFMSNDMGAFATGVMHATTGVTAICGGTIAALLFQKNLISAQTARRMQSACAVLLCTDIAITAMGSSIVLELVGAISGAALQTLSTSLVPVGLSVGFIVVNTTLDSIFVVDDIKYWATRFDPFAHLSPNVHVHHKSQTRFFTIAPKCPVTPAVILHRLVCKVQKKRAQKQTQMVDNVITATSTIPVAHANTQVVVERIIDTAVPLLTSGAIASTTLEKSPQKTATTSVVDVNMYVLSALGVAGVICYAAKKWHSGPYNTTPKSPLNFNFVEFPTVFQIPRSLVPHELAFYARIPIRPPTPASIEQMRALLGCLGINLGTLSSASAVNTSNVNVPRKLVGFSLPPTNVPSALSVRPGSLKPRHRAIAYASILSMIAVRDKRAKEGWIDEEDVDEL